MHHKYAGQLFSEAGMKKKKTVLIARIAVLILSIILIAFGAYKGKAKDTQNKGSMICLECIGLG